jgi:hypothetical protein
MKTLSAAVVGLVIALFAQVASAYVVQVMTAVPLAPEVSAEGTGQLDAAVESAVRDVLTHAIAFRPTIVKIQDARIIGERLYLVLLMADAEDESIVEAQPADPAAESESETQGGDVTGGTLRPGALRL